MACIAAWRRSLKSRVCGGRTFVWLARDNVATTNLLVSDEREWKLVSVDLGVGNVTDELHNLIVL